MNINKMIFRGVLFASLTLNQAEALSFGRFFRFFIPGKFTFGAATGALSNQFINSEYYNAKSIDAISKALVKDIAEEYTNALHLSDSEREKMVNDITQDMYSGPDSEYFIGLINKISKMAKEKPNNNEMIVRLAAFGYSKIIKFHTLYRNIQCGIGDLFFNTAKNK